MRTQLTHGEQLRPLVWYRSVDWFDRLRWDTPDGPPLELCACLHDSGGSADGFLQQIRVSEAYRRPTEVPSGLWTGEEDPSRMWFLAPEGHANSLPQGFGSMAPLESTFAAPSSDDTWWLDPGRDADLVVESIRWTDQRAREEAAGTHTDLWPGPVSVFRRRYLLGWGTGGELAWRLLTRYPGEFHAAALFGTSAGTSFPAVGAQLQARPLAGNGPQNLLVVHGANDIVYPIATGTVYPPAAGSAYFEDAHVRHSLGLSESIDPWLALLGLTPADGVPEAAEGAAAVRSWYGAGAVVRRVISPTGGHEWPSEDDPAWGFDGLDLALRFFQEVAG